MRKATAKYAYQGRSIIVDIQATTGATRTFRIDGKPLTSRASLYEAAYADADQWARFHRVRLECFRPK